MYVTWFNRLSYISCSSVLLVNNKKRSWKSRCASLLNFFIETACHCAELGNFNSCMAIALGLTLSPVARLTKIWQQVDQAKLKLLQHIINPNQNFKNYRVIFKAISGKLADNDDVIIPFFSLFVKDMYFLGSITLNDEKLRHIAVGSDNWTDQMKQITMPIQIFRRCQASKLKNLGKF